MGTVANKLAGALDRHRAGDLDRAGDLYREILREVPEQAPEHAEALHMLGVVATQQGGYAEATELIGRAIALDETKTKYHYHLGEALRVQGNFEAALASYRRAVDLDPAFADAYNAIGITQLARGEFQAAADVLDRAGQLAPSHSRAHANHGMALRKLGQAAAALIQFATALSLAPEDPVYRRYFTATLDENDGLAVPAEARALLESGLRKQGFGGLGLAGPAVAVLRRAAWFGPLVAMAAADDLAGLATAIADGRLDELFQDSLLGALLECAVVAEPELEMGLAAVRRVILRSTRERNLVLERVFALHPAFVAALAVTGFNADYAWLESFEEAEAADLLARNMTRQLRAEGEMGPPDEEVEFWSMLLLLACFRPLNRIPGTEQLLDPALPDLPAFIARVVDQQIRAPREERRLAAGLAAATPMDDPHARRIGLLRDRFPYPRWSAAGARPPSSLVDMLRAVSPSFRPPAFAHGPIRLLAPGCGTGRAAVDLARRLPDAEVWAVDLSRGRLGYAARLAAELGVDNLTFAQGDLSELGTLDRRFHVIALADALHRLADPLAAWRVLVGLLEPAGLMQVSLPSRAGRAPFDPIWQAITARGVTGEDEAGLRLARQIVLDMPREGAAGQMLRSAEFYALGGCRELLFAGDGRDFALPEIEPALAALELRLIGLEMTDPRAVIAYAKRYPDDHARTDLDRWQAIERDHPRGFFGVYQFWCQKTG